MIVISHGILSVWTCRIDEARAEPCARSAAATPLPHSLLNNHHRPPSSFTCRRGGTCIEAAGASAPDSSLSVNARSRAETGFWELGEQTSGSWGERKMEVRVGERLLCLAVLSSVLCMDSVLGKYVRGVVNTKEVSVCFPPSIFNLLPCDNDPTARWQKRNRLECESARRCLFGGLFR